MNTNIFSTHHIHHNLLVYETGVLHVSGTYHLSSTDDYHQLSITHLVDKHKISRYKDTYGRVLPCNLSLFIQEPYK
jgi:hypothetical protein